MANKGRQMSTAEKFEEYQQLRERAHRKVDTLTRFQLRKFIKRNGREFEATNLSGTQPNKTRETRS